MLPSLRSRARAARRRWSSRCLSRWWGSSAYGGSWQRCRCRGNSRCAVTTTQSGTGAAIDARIEELLAAMTPAEKAGQLTQYFYFGGRGGRVRRRPRRSLGEHRRRRRGRAGPRRGRFAAVHHRPGRDQPAAAAHPRRQPARHSGDLRVRRDPRPADDPAGADRDGRLLGPRDHRARPGGRRPGGPGGRHPLGVRADGRHRSRPALGPDHRGRRRGPLSRRCRRRGPGPRVPGRRARHAGADHRRAEALRRLRRGDRRPRLRRGEPVRLRPVERLPAAVQGGRRRRRGQHHDGVHGPQRHPRLRQRLAVRRRAARGCGASRASSSATPTRCAT